MFVHVHMQVVHMHVCLLSMATWNRITQVHYHKYIVVNNPLNAEFQTYNILKYYTYFSQKKKNLIHYLAIFPLAY